MAGPAILFTNHTLAERAGSELYVRDLAIALHARGYRTMAFSPQVGDVAAELESAGVPVVTDPTQVPWRPDLIHGQHHLTAMAAMIAHPGVPATYVCHGTTPWPETPPVFPAIRRYAGVGLGTRDFVARSTGADPADIPVVPNWVDVSRFPPRRPLPARPARALILSNTATRHNYAGLIEEALGEQGVQVRIAGAAAGDSLVDPGPAMRAADLVVAKGRTALEALASGCAVIVADTWGLSGMVTAADLDRMRQRNLGIGAMTQELTVPAFLHEFHRYDATDAAIVSRRIRAEADITAGVDRWEQLYAEILASGGRHDGHEERVATVRYLNQLSDTMRSMEVAVDEWREVAHGAQTSADPRLIARQQAQLVRQRDELTRRSGVRGSAGSLLAAVNAAARARLTPRRSQP